MDICREEIVRWEEIIKTTMRVKLGWGFVYPDGTFDDALNAASAVSTEYAKIAAIENVLNAREQRVVNARPR